MSLRTFFVGILAVAAGVAAAVSVNQFANTRPQTVSEPETVAIVVANEPIERGERLSPGALTTQDWPVDLVPPDTLRDVTEVTGRVSLTEHHTGQPIFSSHLAPEGSVSGLAVLVPSGMRAFTIHTPTVASGVAGFVQPGNTVDVLVTVTLPTDRGGPLSLTLLQNIEVLAVDEVVNAPSSTRVETEKLQSVTLLVNPLQAEKLSLAQSKGTLQLALRNPTDTLAADTEPISLADLKLLAGTDIEPKAVEVEAPQPIVPVAEAKHDPVLHIRTLRGTHNSLVVIRPNQEQETIEPAEKSAEPR